MQFSTERQPRHLNQNDFNHSEAQSYKSHYGQTYAKSRISSERAGVSPGPQQNKNNNHIYVNGLNQDLHSQNSSMISQSPNPFNNHLQPIQHKRSQDQFTSPQPTHQMIPSSSENHLQLRMQPSSHHQTNQGSLVTYHHPQSSVMTMGNDIPQQVNSIQTYNSTGHQSPIFNVQIPHTSIPQSSRDRSQIPTIPEVSHETEPVGSDFSQTKAKSIEELQKMMDDELKMKREGIDQSITSSRGHVKAVEIPPNINIKVICRIKPSKIINDSESSKNLEFQRNRQFRSSSRGRVSFSFNSQHPNQTGQSGSDQQKTPNLAIDSVRSVNSQQRTSNFIQISQRGIKTQQSPSGSNINIKSRTAAKQAGNTFSRGLSVDSSERSERFNKNNQTGQINSQIPNTARARASDSLNSRMKSQQKLQRSNSLGQQPLLMYNKMLKNDAQYCIFTTREASKTVIASDAPYSGKLLNDALRTTDDIPFLQNQPVHFQFDQVYDETSTGRQEKVYVQNVRPIVHNFIEGKSGCVILLGPSDCGKTFTLKGSQGAERGIAPRAIEDVLSIIKNTDVYENQLNNTPSFSNGSQESRESQKCFLKMAIYMIAMDEIIDLLNRPRKFQDEADKPKIEHFLDQNQNQIISQLTGITERLVFSSEDFYAAISDAYRYRKELGFNKFNDKELRKKTHFIISLNLLQKDPRQEGKVFNLSQLNLVELSGSEQAVNPGNTFQNIRDTPIHEFVSKSFNSLSCHLMRMLQRSKKSDQSMINEDSDTKLIGCLRQTLSLNSNILVINCVDPSENLFEHCLPSLKFCASIREQIQKKIKKLKSVKKEKKEKIKQSKRQTTQQEMPNLLLSQIKASERSMKDINQKLMDYEFALEQNHLDQEVAAKCYSNIQHLKELERDFETLLQYCQVSESDQKSEIMIELIRSSKQSRSKLNFLKERIQRMIENPNSRQYDGQRLNSLESYEQSEGGIQVYNNQWSNDDPKQSTMRSAELASASNGMPITSNKHSAAYLQQNQSISNGQHMMNTFEDSNARQTLNYQPSVVSHEPPGFQQQFNTVDVGQYGQKLHSGYPQTQAPSSIITPSNFRSFSRSRSRSKENKQVGFEKQTHEQSNNHQQLQVFHPTESQSNPASARTNQRNNSEMKQQSMFNPTGQFQIANTVKQLEGRFAYIKSEIQMPKLITSNELPTIDQIKAKIPPEHSKQASLIEQAQSKQLYRSEDELVNDVQRLMLLQDQDGLKMRVLSLYRDKDQILATAQTQIQAIMKEHSDCKAKEILLNEHAEALTANIGEINNFTLKMQEKYTEVECELMDGCRNFESQIQLLEQKITEMKEEQEIMLQEKNQAQNEREQEHKLRIEADKQAREQATENEKLKKNYEILKEHEMNVIRDCEQKKNTEVKEKQDALFEEKEKYIQQQLKLENQANEIIQLKEQIMQLQNDVKMKESEKEGNKNKIQELNVEVNSYKQEVQGLHKKHGDDLDIIANLKRQHENFRIEHDNRMKDIDDLRLNIHRNNQQNDAQNQYITQLKSEIKALQSDIEQYNCDKEGFQQQIHKEKEQNAQLKTEKEILMKKFMDEQASLKGQSESLRGLVAQKDQELLSIKAGEFDKVDVIKQLAEAEGKTTFLKNENERIKTQLSDVEAKSSGLEHEVERLRSVLKSKDDETKEISRQHNSNLDEFDNKFDNLHQKLQSSLDENQKMKAIIQQLKNQSSELEKERLYWKEKCKQAERKSDEIGSKIQELETELKAIIFDRQAKSFDHRSIDSDSKSDFNNKPDKNAQIQHKKQVFGDIQSMISQYKQQRSDSKTRDSENRPRQFIHDATKIENNGFLPPRYSPLREQKNTGSGSGHQSEPTIYSEKTRSNTRIPPSGNSGSQQKYNANVYSTQNSKSRLNLQREDTLGSKPGNATFGTATPSRKFNQKNEYQRLSFNSRIEESEEQNRTTPNYGKKSTKQISSQGFMQTNNK